MDAKIPSPPKRTMDRPIKRAPWRKPALALLVGIGLAGGALAFYSSLPQAGTMRVSALALDRAIVTRGPFQDYLPVRGEIVPLSTYVITADATGRVETVTGTDGERVTRGQVLAELANPDLTLQVTTKESEITGRISDASGQIITLQKNENDRAREIMEAGYSLHKAEQELTKRQYLLAQNVINEANLKQYIDERDYQRTHLAAIKDAWGKEAPIYAAQRRQVQQNADRLQASLVQVHDSLKALTIRSPDKGRLTDFTLKPGQSVKQGDTLGQVDSDDAYKIKALIDEYYLGRLAPNLPAAATIHGETRPVKVAKIFPQIVGGRVTVELTFDGSMPTDLKRGEAVDVRLTLGETKPALLVANGAWLNDSGGTSIFVVTGTGEAADRRPITIGRRNPDYVEILAGLEPGETVLTALPPGLAAINHLILTESAHHD